MATKTFSGRADAEKILLADALARQEYGLSFGQYCSGVLVALPDTRVHSKKKGGVAMMLSLAKKHQGSDIARLSDQEIRDLVASRYE